MMTLSMLYCSDVQHTRTRGAGGTGGAVEAPEAQWKHIHLAQEVGCAVEGGGVDLVVRGDEAGRGRGVDAGLQLQGLVHAESGIWPVSVFEQYRYLTRIGT